MMKKIKITMCILALVIMLIPISNVQAALQANPNTHYKKTDNAINWMTNIRYMESTGGAMGLNETINGTTKVATSESNNIDMHMIRSTEYGAIAILSASGYGNPKTMQASAIKSTTGNKSGVYFGSNWEVVAGGVQGSIFSGVDGRYYDTYTTSNASARVGDGLGMASTKNPGTSGWHSAGNMGWVSGGAPYFRRSGDALFFSFHYSTAGDTSNYSHGVAVVGTGL